MYPHERSLVERLKSQPFALIGVNSDSRERALEAVEKNELTWRSFWAGPDGTQGPIPRRWNVTGWPTIYVLDHEGTIRFKDLRGEDLDAAVDQLLGEVEDEGASGKKRE